MFAVIQVALIGVAAVLLILIVVTFVVLMIDLYLKQRDR